MNSLWRRKADEVPADTRPLIEQPIRHHPTQEELLDYAVGAGELWLDVFIACHLTLCPTCRKRVTLYDALGGALISNDRDALEALVSRPKQAKDPTQRLGPRAQPYQRRGGPVRLHEEIARNLPRPLHPFMRDAIPRFRRQLLGLEHIPLSLKAGGRPVRLVRLKPGFVFDNHGHTGIEWMLILSGQLRDDRTQETFGRGDVSRRDQNDVHRQVVDRCGPCIVLIAQLGPTLPRTLTGRLLSRLTGL